MVRIPMRFHRRGGRKRIAAPDGIGKAYVSRVLRLALLAPNIVEAILEGEGTTRLRWSSRSDCRLGAGISRRRLIID
jgi:hypothetical protein